MVTAAVALAEASIVAVGQEALEAIRNLLPLPGAAVRIGAARGSAGAHPERHWAGAPPSAPPFARLSRRDFTPSRLFRRPCTDGYAGRSIHRDAAECFGSFVRFRVLSSVQPQNVHNVSLPRPPATKAGSRPRLHLPLPGAAGASPHHTPAPRHLRRPLAPRLLCRRRNPCPHADAPPVPRADFSRLWSDIDVMIL